MKVTCFAKKSMIIFWSKKIDDSLNIQLWLKGDYYLIRYESVKCKEI